MTYDRLPFTETDRRQYMAILGREADIVQPTESLEVIDRDPDDDMFLECAVAGEATYLVSGDTHLLDLGSFRELDIITAGEFLTRTE